MRTKEDKTTRIKRWRDDHDMFMLF